MGMDPSVTGLVGGAILGAALSRNQKSPAPPPAAPPATAPQPARSPDAMGIYADMQQTASAQPSTFLTGPQGVDQKKVKVLRNQLYGSDD